MMKLVYIKNVHLITRVSMMPTNTYCTCVNSIIVVIILHSFLLNTVTMYVMCIHHVCIIVLTKDEDTKRKGTKRSSHRSNTVSNTNTSTGDYDDDDDEEDVETCTCCWTMYVIQ